MHIRKKILGLSSIKKNYLDLIYILAHCFIYTDKDKLEYLSRNRTQEVPVRAQFIDVWVGG